MCDVTASIMGVAKTLAEGAMSYYPGTATVRFPGSVVRGARRWCLDWIEFSLRWETRSKGQRVADGSHAWLVDPFNAWCIDLNTISRRLNRYHCVVLYVPPLTTV